MKKDHIPDRSWMRTKHNPPDRRIAWQSRALAEVCHIVVEMTSRNTTRGWGVGMGAWEHRDRAFPARCRPRFGNLIRNLTHVSITEHNEVIFISAFG